MLLQTHSVEIIHLRSSLTPESEIMNNSKKMEFFIYLFVYEFEWKNSKLAQLRVVDEKKIEKNIQNNTINHKQN